MAAGKATILAAWRSGCRICFAENCQTPTVYWHCDFDDCVEEPAS